MPSNDASHFDPPAPVARVMLRNPHSGATVSDVLLLLDTGADITLLPHTAVEPLGVPLLAGQRYELMGFDGSKSFASRASPTGCRRQDVTCAFHDAAELGPRMLARIAKRSCTFVVRLPIHGHGEGTYRAASDSLRPRRNVD
jgi:hypothetical protein